MRRIVIAGHRGVGKSTLLKDLAPLIKKYNYATLDLDDKIESLHGSLDAFFLEGREPEFRDLEQKVFQEAIAKFDQEKQDWVVSVGGGFSLELWQGKCETIWLRRDTDTEGRIFLNRPRLSSARDPLAEYLKRFRSREPKFAKFADFFYDRPEGATGLSGMEMEIWDEFLGPQGGPKATKGLRKHWAHDAFISVQNFQQMDRWKGFARPEVRTDLFPFDEFEKIPADALLSFRNETLDLDLLNADTHVWDWDVTLRPSLFPEQKPGQLILSSHEADIYKAIRQLDLAMAKWNSKKPMMKLCPVVTTWSQLKDGWNWQRMDAVNRSFLPRSGHGKWIWFRRWMRGRQFLNFIRDQKRSNLDQPTFWQWIRTPQRTKEFAALLGHPVAHSHSPMLHDEYFHKSVFFNIDVHEKEFREAFTFLEELGLSWAAVTSPLKKVALKDLENHIGLKTPAVERLKICNTLKKVGKSWAADLTDPQGLSMLLKEVQQNSVIAVWGVGALKESIKTLLPRAQFYPARTGVPEVGIPNPPEVLVWACGRTAVVKRPPPEWSPKLLLDLSYHENSMGLELASSYGCRYINGLEMLHEQARHQQIFWSQP